MGTGFLSRNLVVALQNHGPFVPSVVLTRRRPWECGEFPCREIITNSLSELLDKSELVIECSGDVLHATEVIARALDAGLPVVTMDAEFQVTTGSWFVGKGLLTEAEGDQPGCLASLRENVRAMGFRPLVYGNIKGFLNHTPLPQEMEYWSARNGIRIRQVTSFTDGTKLQIEQALVANGLNAAIVQAGMLGVRTDDLNHAASVLSSHAAGCGGPISDYVLSAKLPPGVFIIAEHDRCHREGLRYLKMGDGPYYVLLRNYHLCHLEVSKTIHRVCAGGGVLLDNSAHPRFGVFARSKRILLPGERIAYGIGSYDVRGVAIGLRAARGMIPIGLIQDAVVARRVVADEFVGMDDVEIPESLALHAWLAIRAGAGAGE